MHRLRLFGFMLALFSALATAAPPSDDAALPDVLKDWRGWVLKDMDYRTCPFLATPLPGNPETFVCAWPGRLALDANASGAKFTVHWQVDAPSWIVLPGDTQQWPQGVTVNKQPQPVLPRGDQPALWLAKGSYEIAGNFFWRERPQSLRIPASIGLIALSVDGKTVAPLQRDAAEVTLGRSQVSVPEADSIDVRVFRKLDDGVPAMLSTQIRLSVSGQAREETLGPALPAGFEAIALSGDWPARLDSDGRLHVQVQPGGETLTVQARALAPLASVAARLPASAWPKQEIWSYQAMPRLRISSPSAAVAVDPRQAEVPNEWLGLPAFALGNEDKITIEQRSRGLAPDDANRLTLQREAWLDFAGEGWYARDYVRGTMVQGWRLDVAAPLSLERAEATASRNQDGAAEALLITHGASTQTSGVEWRTPAVDLAGGVRISAVSSLPASGWQQTFDEIDTTLHFPFGYKLLAAPGADSVSGSWMARWTLLDIFVAAILVLLAWRLLGLIGAMLAILYVLLGYQESGAPFWSLLAVLGLALIVRALPAGKLQRAAEWSRRFALLILVCCGLPFLAGELRLALYPQLENTGVMGSASGNDANSPYRKKMHRTIPVGAVQDAASMDAPAPPPPASPMPMQAPSGGQRGNAIAEAKAAAKPALETIIVTGSNIPKSTTIDHYSQSTVMQTGAGEPGWNIGSTAVLRWTGPVLPTQTVQLVIAPPWLVRPLRVILAGLLIWLAWRAFGAASLPRTGARAAASMASILLSVGLLASAPASAQSLPSDELLQQLRARLTEAPKCAPACANLSQAQIAAAGDSLDVALDVHAGERIAFPLPALDGAAMLKSIKVDGNGDALIARTADGKSWIALDRGVHRVDIGYVAYADKIALNFALPPARIVFDGKGWSASGIQDDRLPTATLSLARAREQGAERPLSGSQQFAPYVSVQRSLNLGLDWTLRTFVQRISPASGGFTLSIPLLPGEHVSSSGIKVQNVEGKGATATVGIPDGSNGEGWSSTLDKGDTLSLTAPPLGDRAEVWQVLVSPTWHVEFSGVPGVGPAPDDDAGDYRNFEFHPLPGETLTLTITRPAPTQGAVRAIDAVNVSSEVGQRAASALLSFTLRASQGGEQAIGLPSGSEVLSVKRDNDVLNVRAQDGKLSLPVKPGAQRYEIRFRDNAALSTLIRTPQITLGLPAANVDLELQIPADRWLLAASGPLVGPAVLYWGQLALLIAFAFVLAKTRRTRLRFHDWLLLGLGFSTFSWLALIVVVVWLFAFDWRSRRAADVAWWRFDLAQIGLVVLTGAALLSLVSAIPQGLLGQPDMHVVGNASSAEALRWFADRSNDALPQASAISVPLWVYKVLMLAWALWLANALILWLRDGFAAWTRGGYWQPRPKAPVAPIVATADSVTADSVTADHTAQDNA